MSVLFLHSFNSSYLLSGRSSSAKNPNFKQNKKWKQGWNKIEEEDEQAEEESEHVESAPEEDQDEEDDLDTDEEGNTPKKKEQKVNSRYAIPVAYLISPCGKIKCMSERCGYKATNTHRLHWRKRAWMSFK